MLLPTPEVEREIRAGSQALRDYLQSLQDHVVELTYEVKALTARVKQTPVNSHCPPSSDVFIKPTSLRVKTGRKMGGQPGHKGSTLRLALPADQVIRLPVSCCEHCHADLSEVLAREHVKRQVQDVEIRPVSIDYLAEKKTCPHCQKTVTAAFPVGVSHYLQYGPEITAIAVYLNQANFIPLDRLSTLIKDVFGISLSQGTLVNRVKDCSLSLEEALASIKRYLLASPTAHFDETGMRGMKKTQWLHSFSTALYTYVEIHQKRGNEATNAIGLLPKYHGTMVHDFWKSYFFYTQCAHALCNAHILRELTGIEENHHFIWAGEMKSLLTKIHGQVESAGGVLCYEAYREFTEQYDAILARGRVEDPIRPAHRAKGQRGRVAKSKSQNLQERLFQYKEDILRFAAEIEVPFDNNLAERDIRMCKLHQKVSGCFRSERGMKDFTRIRSYLSSARKHGSSMHDALFRALTGHPLFVVRNTP